MKSRFLTTVVLLAMGCCMAMAQKVTIDGIEYKADKNGTAYVSGSDKYIERAEIRSEVEIDGKKYTVVRFGYWQPFIGRKNLQFVSIPNSIMKIGPGEFSGCRNLTEVIIPDKTISIAGDAFAGCSSLTSITIPNSVTSIGKRAFWECSSLTEIIVPDHPINVEGGVKSNGKLESESSFEGCDAITTIRCHNGSIPAYMLNKVPATCPFMLAQKYQQPAVQQPQVVYVQAPQQQNTTLPAAQEQVKAPSSDVDIDIPTVSGDNENTFAVIIANENYQEEVKVEYAINDGEMFKQYCQMVLGLPEDNIHIRKDATRNNLIAEVAWMQKVAEAYKGDARFIVYYAGHGIPDEKSGTSYLLPVDGKGTMLETGYSLQQLYQQLGNMPSAGVTIFMDACFSGSKRGDGMLTSARGVAIKAKTQAPQGKMVVFSAAQGDETAYPFKEKEHGMFTYYLLKKLKNTKGNVTLGELGQYVTDQVSRKSIVSNGKSQTPSVSTSASMGSNWKAMKLK